MSSLADAVVACKPVTIGGAPQPQVRNPATALGQRGSLILEFVDNRLTGSGSSALDLWIFEVGPDVEDTFVSIRRDGVTFLDMGKVLGATAGIDIDAFGFGPSDLLRFVRLIDDRLEGGGVARSVELSGCRPAKRRRVPRPMPWSRRPRSSRGTEPSVQQGAGGQSRHRHGRSLRETL